MATSHSSLTVAQFLVQCLENEGVRYVFGLPGEENIHLVERSISARTTTSSTPSMSTQAKSSGALRRAT